VRLDSPRPRFKSHRSTTGEYVPGTFSNDDELMALAMAMAADGTGVFQIVPHGAGGDVMGEPATRKSASTNMRALSGSRARRDVR